MIKLQIKGFVSDMGYMDSWNDVHEFPELDDNSSIRQVMFHFFRKERESDDKEIERINNLIESRKWSGGRWKEEDGTIKYESDVTEEEYELIS